MINKRLLKSRMAMFGDSGITLSDLMDITPQTFSNKINEKSGKMFNKKEIDFFIKRYELTPKDVIEIFFNEKVS